MTKKIHIFTRKKALIIVFALAVVLLGLILLLYNTSGDDLSTVEGRQAYLLGLGWEIDPATEEHRSVVVPDILEGVMEDYNKMQLEQGCDLSRHLGEKCDQYTYELKNYPGNSGSTVLITIYVQGRELIAGDIHTAAINGFMHGIKRAAE